MAGSHTVTKKETFYGNNVIAEYDIEVTTNSAGAFTTAAIQVDPITGFMMMGVTDPGSTAPSVDYDISILDDEGVDVFGGELNDRSATASEQAKPKIGNAYDDRWVNSSLSIALANNTAAAATTQIKLFVKES